MGGLGTEFRLVVDDGSELGCAVLFAWRLSRLLSAAEAFRLDRPARAIGVDDEMSRSVPLGGRNLSTQPTSLGATYT